jgi:hypothetical protein
MCELSVDEFRRALARYGFALSGNRIFDLSGRGAGNSWPIVLNATLQMDRRRTIRMSIKERADEIARRTGGKLRNERR